MLDKNNPLQMSMLEAGRTELEICKYFRDIHENCMNITLNEKDIESIKITKEGNAWHKKEYLRHCKMVEKLTNDALTEESEGGRNNG